MLPREPRSGGVRWLDSVPARAMTTANEEQILSSGQSCAAVRLKSTCVERDTGRTQLNKTGVSFDWSGAEARCRHKHAVRLVGRCQQLAGGAEND